MMAGHSKWAQIKRQKGVTDARRSQTFAKLANLITIAARNGADPTMNFQLRIAVDRARAANVPNDNIKRAIERASGAGAAAMEEILYEAYGPGGIAYLIEAATDNHNRTTGDIRAVLNKYGGKMADAGSVSYLFHQRGLLVYDVVGKSGDELELQAIDAGADDVDLTDNKVYVYTLPKELEQVKHELAEQDLVAEDVSLEWEPAAPIHITDAEAAQKIIRLAETLEELDDVSKVATNAQIDDSVSLEN